MMQISIITAFLLCSLASFAPLLAAAARQPIDHTVDDASTEVGFIQSAPVNDDPLPSWPKLFNVEFNETSIILLKRRTAGKWWYDAANGNEIITREDGRGDRYCGGAHPINPTPCTHLVTGGNRYLIFPDWNECCLCCTAEKGCGIVSPNWLDGAQYQVQEEKFGKLTNKWLKKGLQSNYYWATADDAQLPIELDMWPNYYQTFHPETFTTEAIDPSLLEVPANCKPKCPISTICTVL